MQQLRRAIHPLAIWLTAALIPFQGVGTRTFCCHEKPAERNVAQSNCCPCQGCCPCCHVIANPPGDCSQSCECSPPPEPCTIDSRLVETRRDGELEALSSVSAAEVNKALVISSGRHILSRDGFFRTTGNQDCCALLCRYLL